MQVKIKEVDSINIYSLTVEHIDAANYEDVERMLTEMFDPTSKAILDLEGVEFIDSSGIGAILYCVRQLDKHDQELRISNVNEAVRSAFELVRLDRLLQICDTTEDAITAIKGQ